MADILVLLNWIKDSKRGILESNTLDGLLEDLKTFIGLEIYEAIIFYASNYAYEIPVGNVIEAYPIEKLIREIEKRGPKDVFLDFIDTYECELKKYKRRKK